MAIKHLSDSDFKDTVETDGVVLVDFWAPWCGPCKMLGPELEEASKELESSMVVAKVNVDENANVARQYRVMSIPTMIVFKNGKEVDRNVGFAEKTKIIEFAKKHL